MEIISKRIRSVPTARYIDSTVTAAHSLSVSFRLFLNEAMRADIASKAVVLAGTFIIIMSPALGDFQERNTIAVSRFTPQATQEAIPYALASEGLSTAQKTEEDDLKRIAVLAHSAIEANLAPPVREQVVLRRLWVPITAYSSTPDQTDSTPFITASGTRTRDGVIAANFLPIGTKVKIPALYGDKVFIVEDRMNKRYWLRMDIWMATRAEAREFGKRNVPVEIIREI